MFATHTAPSPVATERGAAPTGTVSSTALVSGSIRDRVLVPVRHPDPALVDGHVGGLVADRDSAGFARSPGSSRNNASALVHGPDRTEAGRDRHRAATAAEGFPGEPVVDGIDRFDGLGAAARHPYVAPPTVRRLGPSPTSTVRPAAAAGWPERWPRAPVRRGATPATAATASAARRRSRAAGVGAASTARAFGSAPRRLRVRWWGHGARRSGSAPQAAPAAASSPAVRVAVPRALRHRLRYDVVDRRRQARDAARGSRRRSVRVREELRQLVSRGNGGCPVSAK